MVDKIKQIIAAILDLPINLINESTSTKNVENWDSLNHLKIILAIEDEFNMRLNNDEIVLMNSFPLLVEIVKKKMNAN